MRHFESAGGIIVSCDIDRNYSSDTYPIYRFRLLFPEYVSDSKVYEIRDSLENYITRNCTSTYYRAYCHNLNWVYQDEDFDLKEYREMGHCAYLGINHHSLFPGFSKKEDRDNVMNKVINILINI